MRDRGRGFFCLILLPVDLNDLALHLKNDHFECRAFNGVGVLVSSVLKLVYGEGRLDEQRATLSSTNSYPCVYVRVLAERN